MTTTQPPQPTVEVSSSVVGYRRRDNGDPLRAAMAETGATIQGLAAKIGVNWRTVGFLVSPGVSARSTCSREVGEKIAAALGRPVGDLFEARTVEVVRVAGVSAHSRIEVDRA